MDKHRSKIATLMAIVLTGALLTLLLGLSVNDTRAQQQQFTGNENHVITLDQAVKYIHNFRSNRTVPAINGGYFGRNIFEKILSQEGCVGLRYYYANQDDGAPTLVLVGVDSTGNDLDQGILGEEILPCPPICPGPGSKLNK